VTAIGASAAFALIVQLNHNRRNARTTGLLIGSRVVHYALMRSSTADRVAMTMLAIFMALMVALQFEFGWLVLVVWWLSLISLLALSLVYFALENE